MTRVTVVGGGIVGLATARAVLTRAPAAKVTVLEKEQRWAAHQTGRNSGVIHSGIYYAPGSAKARMCRAGAASMTAYVNEHDIPYENCGKLIVATSPDELPGLQRLHDRGVANGVAVARITPEQAREIEPHVQCIAALHVRDTSITDYAQVCATLASGLAAAGSDLRLGCELIGLQRHGEVWVAETSAGPVESEVLINCAGLYCDSVATMAGAEFDCRIVPFRGEYFELAPGRRDLVRGLIYPVPDPDFPFLGVHLTRMVDGGVHAGPNAVLALAREGYRWRTVRPRELAATLGYRGFRALARRHARQGAAEMARSLSRRRFAASLARLVPEVAAADLVRAPAGVRAQALRPDGGLVDDFLIVEQPGAVHVLNAPSPAATSSLEIGAHVATLALDGRD